MACGWAPPHTSRAKKSKHREGMDKKDFVFSEFLPRTKWARKIPTSEIAEIKKRRWGGVGWGGVGIFLLRETFPQP